MKIITPKKAHFVAPAYRQKTFTLTKDQIEFLSTYSNASAVIRDLINAAMKEEGAANVSE